MMATVSAFVISLIIWTSLPQGHHTKNTDTASSSSAVDHTPPSSSEVPLGLYIIEESPRHLVALPNTTVTLPCRVAGSSTASGQPDVTIVWRKDGRRLSPDETSRLTSEVTSTEQRYILEESGSLVIPALSQAYDGDYQCVATDSIGSVVSRSASLTTANLQAFLRGPETVTVQEGISARLSCRADGVPFPEVTWYKDDQPLDSSQPHRFITLPKGILHILNTTAQDSGAYKCRADNTVGHAYSDEGVLSVTPSESELETSRFLAGPQAQELQVGENAVFECITTHGDIVWTRQDGSRIKLGKRRHQVGGVLYIVDVRNSDEGIYYCQLHDEPRKRVYATLQILEPPTPKKLIRSHLKKKKVPTATLR